MRNPVERLAVTDTADRLALLAAVAGDVRDAGRVGELITTEGDSFEVEVTLGDPD